MFKWLKNQIKSLYESGYHFGYFYFGNKVGGK